MPMHLLRSVQLYAPTPMGIVDVLVGGGRVLQIAPRLELPATLDVAVVDGAGRRCIPGLIDGHVHVTGGGGEAGPHTKVPPVPLSKYTLGGITAVVGLLGTDDVTRTTAELVTGIHGLRAEGLSAWGYTGGYHLPPTTLTGSVRGDLAHVECLIGIGEVAISDHRSSQPTLDELLRLAADAHVSGLLTGKAGILHLHLGDGARGLELVRAALATSEIPARVFNPTHVNRRRALFEEAVALTASGCTVDITAFPVDEGEDAWDAATALVRFWDSGASAERVTCSTDGGGCLPHFDADGRVAGFGVGDPGALMQTLQQVLARGVPMERALVPFTTNPARTLRLARKGAIVEGGDADLVVLGDDGAVHDVMVNGEWHVRDTRAVRLGTFESLDA